MGVITETLRVEGTEKAGQDLKRLGDQAALTSNSIKGVETSGQGASRGLAAMAQQLPDVITQLSMGADAAQVLSVQGLQVAQSMGLMESAMAAVSGIAGPLAIGLAAIVAAGSLVANEMDRASDATDTATRSTDEIRAAAAQAAADVQSYAAAWGTVTNALRDSTTQIAILNGEITANQAAAQGQIAAMEQQAQQQLLALGRAVAVAREARAADPTAANIAAQRAAEEALAAKQAELAQARANIEAVAEYRDETEKAAEAERRAADASRRRADAQRAAAEADRERAASLDELIAMEDRFAAQERANAEAQAQREADARAASQQAAQRAREASAARVQGSALEASLSGFGPGAGMGAGIAGALLGGGGIGSALNVVLPPPWGQIAAALVGLLGQDGAGAIKDLLTGIFGMVDNVLKALPELLMGLMDYLPDLIIGLAESLAPLVEGLLAGAGELVVELIDALPSIIVALVQAVPSIVAALVRGLGVLVIDLVRAIVVELPQAIAELLRGLLTLDRTGAFRGTGRTWRDEWRSGGRGDGINLTINGMVGDGQRLGAGIRGLFDRDFGRIRARS